MSDPQVDAAIEGERVRLDAFSSRVVRVGAEAPDQLLAHPLNWRVHPARQEAILRDVIAQVGWVVPVIVNEVTGHVLDGHLRVALALKEGIPSIPVVYVDVSPTEEKTILTTLDPIAALAIPDATKLAELLADAGSSAPALMEFFGALRTSTQLAINAAHNRTRVDDATPVVRDTTIVRGDQFVLGRHRIRCGDCRDADHVRALMAGERPRVLMADPPYGVSVVSAYGKIGHGGGASVARHPAYRPVIGDDAPFDPAHLWTLADVAIVWGGNYFPQLLPKPGQWIVWDKCRPEGMSFGDCELAWTSRDGIAVHKYACVWNGMTREGESGPRVHPTQKPIKLMRDVMADYSAVGDAVLDPYLGSGSTLIAAEEIGRRCFGMEIDPQYVQVAIDRWEAFTGQKATPEPRA